ncbi:MAG: lipopolysaccharide biosynthesis protein [Caulobacterales bacterium]|nr:lipopolysaccharide biosynthesis protein [Caulobacterales bacterium]
MSIGKKIALGAVWSAVETWGRQATMFIVFALLARILGPETYGILALSMVAPLVLAVPVARGIPDALIQRPEVEDIHFDSAFWFLVTIGAAITAGIWAASGLIASLFDQPILKDVVRWTSLVVLIQSIAAVPAAVLKRKMMFRLFALRTLVGTMTGGAVGVALALSGAGVWSLVGMQLTKHSVEMLVLVFGGAWKPRLRFSFARVRELFGFAGPVVGQNFMILATNEMPNVVLGLFLGPTAVGIYTLARRLYELLVEVLLSPLFQVAMPAVSRIQDDPAKINEFFNTTIRLSTFAAFPAFAGLAAIAPVAVPFVFGEQWIAAVPAIQILMILGMQRAVDSVSGSVMTGLGHAALVFKLTIVHTVLSTAFVALGAQFSIELAVAALVATNIVMLPLFLVFVQRLAKVQVLEPLKLLPRLIVATGLMFVTVTYWRLLAPENLPAFVTMAAGVAFGAVVYGLAAVVLMRPVMMNARDTILKLRSRGA